MARRGGANDLGGLRAGGVVLRGDRTHLQKRLQFRQRPGQASILALFLLERKNRERVGGGLAGTTIRRGRCTAARPCDDTLRTGGLFTGHEGGLPQPSGGGNQAESENESRSLQASGSVQWSVSMFQYALRPFERKNWTGKSRKKNFVLPSRENPFLPPSPARV